MEQELQLMRDNAEAPTPATYQPQADTPIVPRSQVRTLTDEGVKVDEQVAVDMSVEQPTTEPPAATDPTTDALQALLDQHDSSSETPAPEAPADVDPQQLDFDSPRVKALADQFKTELGIDLKEAVESYQRMTEMVNSQAQRQAEQDYTNAANTLKSGWGVNDAEFNRRVEAVLAYADKLPENLRSQFDSVQGIQLLWAQVEKRGASAPTPNSGGDAQRSTNPTGAPSFRKSELMQLMMTNPAKYNAMQADIQRAYEAGSVIDDV